MDQAQKQQSIFARIDKPVFIGFFGCLRPARVNDDYLAAPLLDAPHACGKIRRSHHTAIRHQWISPHDEQVMGAVDIRHGFHQKMAVKIKCGNMVR